MRYIIAALLLALTVAGGAAAHLRLSQGTIDPCEAVADRLIQSIAPVQAAEMSAPGLLVQTNALRSNLGASILRSLRQQDGWTGCYRSLLGGNRTSEEEYYYQKKQAEARRKFGLD